MSGRRETKAELQRGVQVELTSQRQSEGRGGAGRGAVTNLEVRAVAAGRPPGAGEEVPESVACIRNETEAGAASGVRRLGSRRVSHGFPVDTCESGGNRMLVCVGGSRAPKERAEHRKRERVPSAVRAWR